MTTTDDARALVLLDEAVDKINAAILALKTDGASRLGGVVAELRGLMRDIEDDQREQRSVAEAMEEYRSNG